jgi:phosphatidate cytidylyltransferase
MALDYFLRGGLGITVDGGVQVVDSLLKGGIVLAVLGAVLVGAALYEYCRIVESLGVVLWRPLLVAAGVLVFLGQWAGWIYYYMPFNIIPAWLREPGQTAVVVLCAVTFVVLAGRVLTGRVEGSLQAAGLTGLGIVYVSVMLGFVGAIRSAWDVAGVVTFVAVCKITDTGGYFAGTLIGGPKIAPRVSPKKTVAGAIGGTLAAMLVALFISSFDGSILTPRQALLYGLLMGPVAILGDLSESVLKRQADLKDLPVLDLLDSVIFAAPFSYLFFSFIKR